MLLRGYLNINPRTPAAYINQYSTLKVQVYDADSKLIPLD
jgi:hypothetical protein